MSLPLWTSLNLRTTLIPGLLLSFVNALQILKPDYRVRIDKGEVSLFYDSFLDEGPLYSKVDYAHYADMNLTTKDILLNDQWHWNLIATPLSADIKNQLLHIILDEPVDDVFPAFAV